MLINISFKFMKILKIKQIKAQIKNRIIKRIIIKRKIIRLLLILLRIKI